MKATLLLSVLILGAATAEPRISSWYTARSGNYARIYTSTANQTTATTSTTWSRGTGVQSSPVYAGLHEIAYSNDWVYIRTTGLAGHVMGPWYLDAAKTQNFPNFPANTATLYRIPRNPVIPPTTKTATGLGASGYYVNGVAMFDMRDAFSYSTTNAQDATPMNGITGDGIWNREAYHNESVTFDAGFAHQAGSQYHYHAQPPGLRYQLGDHVAYNATTNVYSEMPGLPTSHSPIVAWAADGLPVYGPYGYSDPDDASSGIRRMTSGYRLRSITTRTALPAWAQRVQNKPTLTASQYGPNVSTTYAVGHYLEDYEYLGDVGFAHGTDFDLNEYNVRYCVTPEFPGKTWAYFLTIAAGGTPVYPYATGRQYYGTPSGGAVGSITEAVTVQWQGGPNKQETPESVTPAVGNNDVVIAWSAVEGGTYQITTGDNPATDQAVATPTLTGSDRLTYTDTGARASHAKRFYRANRTALAAFDTNGSNYTPPGGTGGTVSFTFTFPTTPPLPPQNAVTSITVGGVTTSITNYTQGTGSATVSFNNSSLAAGTAYPAILTFTPPGMTARTATSTNTYTR
jgi:hypothetical protein